ncbi:glycoside hydrolase family 88 protein [Ilyomonas limi]|uniref:Glycoside hydrolase family 88 protein n=1 Tax=Ilyomonas limi TaxID=2575867 RepID=A0A4U3KU18_9BACT|nr:glycoside hydrolase family 88 protein [Ilyomonas limi]TKK65832.1 glycoside hydrolase family 88 protein [Ilyomonas limi]
MKYRFNIVLFVCFFVQFAVAQKNTLSYGEQMAATIMTLWKDSVVYGHSRPAAWSYDQGVVYNGLADLWKYTGNADYFRFIKKHIDYYVGEDGSIRTYDKERYNLDNIRNGDALLLLYKITGEEKYRKAASLLYNQLQTQPRTNEGGFWHKKVYPYQMWLDGLYMAEPFYTMYAEITHNDSAFNDVADQFVYAEKHTRDSTTGLMYHGWDESKQQQWANKTTGTSPNFWARAMGWYGMALVDVLEHFPDTNSRKKELRSILNRYAAAIVKVQDKGTGLWWNVLNFPAREGNYPEASASCMFVYTLAKGVRLGYLPNTYLTPAQKGFKGICNTFIAKDDNGLLSLNGTVNVSGLGGDPYRDGSYEYYLREKVVTNDLKGIGAFIQMCSEMELLPTRQLGKGKTILLDGYFNHETKTDPITGDTIQCHYIWKEEDNNGFSMLKNVFTKYGIGTKLLTTSVTPSALNGADMYMIVDPDWTKENPHSHYIEPRNITTIYNWVKNGGVLLLFGNDSGNVEFKHFNQLAAKFGIRFNEDSRNRVQGRNFAVGTFKIQPDDSIFKNAKKIYIKELSTFYVQPPAYAVFTEGGDVIMAVSKTGKGTVFAVGDPWLYNEYLDGRKLPADLENYIAAEDLAQWLIKQTVYKK